MNSENTSKLIGVPETMLITLWAKAFENQQKNPILKDEKAVAIIQKIDYDFKKFKQSKFSQVGICTRAKLIDNQANNFIEKHQKSVVIQIGAGLDTRFHRLGCPKNVIWYDLDVPEVMNLREKLIARQENNHYLAISMFDKAWIEKITHNELPILIIVEGVLMYFTENEVRRFFEMICQHFNKATIVFDMLFYKGVGISKKTDAVSKMKQIPEYQWSMLNSKEIENWHQKIHFSKEFYMSDYYGKRCPFPLNFLYKIPYFYKNFNQRVVVLDIQ